MTAKGKKTKQIIIGLYDAIYFYQRMFQGKETTSTV